MKRDELRTVLLTIVDAGTRETAKRTLRYIRRLESFSGALDLIENDRTVGFEDLLPDVQVRRTRALLTLDALRDFLSRLDNYNGSPFTRIGLNLILLFGCRPSEIRLARWEEFSFEDRVWTVPSERMKMRRVHIAPLSEQTVALLSDLKSLSGDRDILLPGQSRFNQPLSENTFNQALRRMGFEKSDVSAHGFRSTFSTIANQQSDFPPHVIDAALAHKIKGVEGICNRQSYLDQRRELAQWWADYIDGLRKAKKPTV